MDADKPISEKLDEILRQLERSKAEIAQSVEDRLLGFREEFEKTTKEISKLKADKEFVWKREGCRIQHSFNTETLDNLNQLKFALEFKKFDYAAELVETEKTRIEQRNKLIKIADTSEGGWETVKNYVARDVASDSEDDKKITRAENKAVKKIKSKMGRSARSPYYRPRGGRAPSATVSSAEPAAVNSFSMLNQPFRRNSSSGACFSCGGFGHFRRQCPMSGEQQPAQTTGRGGGSAH
ncbi:uncharacterized protein LOC125384331 [Haliotis rufescens]|uniref:uncharacterized protein LOC125384331 n=1 Tax=Haliotis rufescens TaxID=6454 RepID=UPI00201F9433|nr:uncharacterized protein LOC125384331 [Haliotis rufescens]